MQLVAPGAGAYVPLPQSMQRRLELSKVPALQNVQRAAPPSEMEPAGHVRHSVAPSSSA